MADPLSIAASVVSVITAFLQTSQVLVDFVSTVRNAPDEVKAIGRDVAAFNANLLSLQSNLNEPEIATVAANNVPLGQALEGVRLAVENSEEAYKSLIERYITPTASGSRIWSTGQVIDDISGGSEPRLTTRAARDVKWLMQKKAVLQIVQQVNSTKLTLNTSLSYLTVLLQLQTISLTGVVPTQVTTTAKDADIGSLLAAYSHSVLDGSQSLRFRSFMVAFKAREWDLMDKLLDWGVRIDTLDEGGLAPLHYCAQHCDKALADFLLERGAQVNVRDGNGRTVLHHLVLEVLRLPNRGRRTVIKEPRRGYNEEEWGYVLYLLKMLLARDIDVDIKDDDGFTAFWLLLTQQTALQRPLVKEFMLRILGEHMTHPDGRSVARWMLTERWNHDIATVLRRNGKLGTEGEATFLLVRGLGRHPSESRGNGDQVGMALRAGADANIMFIKPSSSDSYRSALDEAVYCDRTDQVITLLKHGADCSGSIRPFVAAVMNDQHDIMQAFLEHGVKVDGLREVGDYADQFGSFGQVNWLCASIPPETADSVVLQDLNAFSPLDFTMTSDVDTQAGCFRFWTALRWKSTKPLNWSRYCPAEQHLKSAKSVKLLLEAGADYKKRHPHERSILGLMVQTGDTEAVSLVLERAVEDGESTTDLINPKDGSEPLLWAVSRIHQADNRLKMLRLLIQHDADLEQDRPMHIYAKRGYEELCSELVAVTWDRGMTEYVDRVDEFGMTAYDIVTVALRTAWEEEKGQKVPSTMSSEHLATLYRKQVYLRACPNTDVKGLTADFADRLRTAFGRRGLPDHADVLQDVSGDLITTS